MNGTPHIAYGDLLYEDGSTPTQVFFNATISSRPGEVLTQDSFDCGYTGGTWYVQCGNFATSWSAGDVLHVDFDDGSGKTGSIEVTLTNDPGDTAGTTTLTGGGTWVKLSLPDTTLFRGNTVEIPVYMDGLTEGDSVLAYQLTVEFDSDVLLAVGAVVTGTMTEAWGEPVTAPRESEIAVGGYTTNQPGTRLDDSHPMLVKLQFVVHGIPSSQTSNTTVVRFLSARVFTLDENITVAHTRVGALTVQENPVPTFRDLTLYPNWNLVSLAIAPEPNALPDVFGGLSVAYVFGYQSGEGPRSWDVNRPDFLNDLKFLSGLRGYWIKYTGGTSTNWHVDGDSISVSTPIPLYNGWNMVGYLPDREDSVGHSLASLGTLYDYIMWFDAASGLPKTWDRARPDFLNDLQILQPLSGFWIKMSGSASLIYPDGGYQVPGQATPEPLARAAQDTIYESDKVCEFWDFWSDGDNGIDVGDVIEAFDADGVLCGRDTVIYEGNLTGFVIRAYGDDADTADIDEGAVYGDSIRFFVNGVKAEIVDGDNVWDFIGFPVSKRVQLNIAATIVDNEHLESTHIKEIKLLQNYPNPFNARTVVPFYMDRNRPVRVTVYNSVGKRVRILIDSDSVDPGYHYLIWDGCDDSGKRVASGNYFIQLSTSDQIKSRKILLLY
jgi:hypothetical protein